MRKIYPVTLIAALALTGALSGCGTVRDSRINPFNWFGHTQSRSVAPSGDTNPLIPTTLGKRKKVVVDTRTPVARIDTLDIARIPGGVIINVSATASVQGSFDVALVPEDADGPVDGVARYTLVANVAGRRGGPVVGTDASRRVVAAARLSDVQLADVRQIEVVGGQNALSKRR